MVDVASFSPIQKGSPLLTQILGRWSRVKHIPVTLLISHQLNINLIYFHGAIHAKSLPAHLLVIQVEGNHLLGLFILRWSQLEGLLMEGDTLVVRVVARH